MSQWALIASLDSLLRFLQDYNTTTGKRPLKLEALIPDYAALIEETRRIEVYIQSVMQQKANEAVINETKRGIAQADSVRRQAKSYNSRRCACTNQ